MKTQAGDESRLEWWPSSEEPGAWSSPNLQLMSAPLISHTLFQALWPRSPVGGGPPFGVRDLSQGRRECSPDSVLPLLRCCSPEPDSAAATKRAGWEPQAPTPLRTSSSTTTAGTSTPSSSTRHLPGEAPLPRPRQLPGCPYKPRPLGPVFIEHPTMCPDAAGSRSCWHPCYRWGN